jgi:G2/mitotic-specific cyclin 3/4
MDAKVCDFLSYPSLVTLSTGASRLTPVPFTERDPLQHLQYHQNADTDSLQPLRPIRALRIRDENAQPQLPSNKALLQRNKSTPALSAMAQQAPNAATTRRKAFADVSNVARKGVKDDSQIASKAKENIIVKDAAIISAKELLKPSALLRPAQRPLANAASKAIVGIDATATAVPKKVTLEANSQPIPKAISKKATTVFREVSSDPATASVAAPAISHRVLELPLETSQNVPATARDTFARPEIVAKIELDRKQTKTLVDAQPTYEYVDALEEKARSIEHQRNEELAKAHDIKGADIEEYWDEDEEEEYFDADGYTTARSLRSRGDNTTGGVTLVLAPRITTKSKRELDAAKLWVDANKTEEEIEDELWDTSMVAEYGDEIFEYMHALEEKMKPNPAYMDSQAEIQWSMRSVLMDWLVQVHNRFTLLPETLFLAVNYVDRFLSAKVVSLGKLQLVGATALFLAAKYEEINCPSVNEIVYMVDGAYAVDEVLKAERFMLSMLNFELGWPGPLSFLRRISKADDYDIETRTLAKYFLEITIMDERFVGCAPSFLAAAAHCLARIMLKKGEWVSYMT